MSWKKKDINNILYLQITAILTQKLISSYEIDYLLDKIYYYWLKINVNDNVSFIIKLFQNLTVGMIHTTEEICLTT